jgi:hypothetical protein
MVQTKAIEDATLDIPEGFVGHRCGRGRAPHDNPPPPPPRAPISNEELLETQNELMRVPVLSEACHGVDRLQHHWQQDINTPTLTSGQLIHRSFLGKRTRLMQVIGFAPPNKNLVYYTAQSIKRLCTPHSS